MQANSFGGTTRRCGCRCRSRTGRRVASTTHGYAPGTRARRGIASRIGRCHTVVSPRIAPHARARCRAAPNTCAAPASSARAAPTGPAGPSSPMPRMLASASCTRSRVPHVLGGSTEASRARCLARGRSVGHARSCRLPGRTRAPRPQPIPCRIGGFGGAEGLARYFAPSAWIARGRRDAPVRRADVRECRRRRGGAWRAAAARSSARPGRRGRAIAGSEVAAHGGRRGRARASPAPRVPDRRPAGARAVRAAPWHSYLIRSIDPPDGAVCRPTRT